MLNVEARSLQKGDSNGRGQRRRKSEGKERETHSIERPKN